jgi:hypothetical protein
MSVGNSAEELMEKFKKKRTKKIMKSAISMVRAFTDLCEGTHSLSHDLWIDLYTYDPLDYGKSELLRIVKALNLLADTSELNWEFRLFASDGAITTMADGSKPPDSDETGFALIPDAE